MVSNVDAARAALVALQDIGIKISLDDFGTGYSSLYNLRELHFDKIKIDRSFVLSMQNNSGSKKIVYSVIDLAKSWACRSSPRALSTGGRCRRSSKRGGEYGQGYYFGKAMPADEAAAAMRRGGARRMRG